jgi:hypothetical protein
VVPSKEAGDMQIASPDADYPMTDGLSKPGVECREILRKDGAAVLPMLFRITFPPAE